MMGAGLAPVQGSDDPGLTLSCLPQTAEVAKVCALMRDVIAAGRPDHAVQMVDAEMHPETMIAVRLNVEEIKKDALAVHLEWRQPAQDWQRGETRVLTVMDRDLNERMITWFFETLWAESPGAR
ncbi:hypothetical protein C8J30_102132 [Rhodobacter viridis]|uniref:Uncharacterized protein n=2 Tax=Rhodobacter viridis TaxID=1054202 RepID=A0A318U1I8_9RHOB|nr:hypothetical protein C8J30_102132 [Rhodobacter viridis]